MNLNLALFIFLHQFAGRSRLLDITGFFVANTLTYLLAAGAVVFVLRTPVLRRKLFAAGEMLLALLIGRGVIAGIIQGLFVHARPFAALGFVPALLPHGIASFPSGHMSALFAVSFVLFKLDRRWGGAYFALSLLVGIGRIFAGVHWPFDILGGIAVGLVGGWVADRLVRASRRALFPQPASAGGTET